MPSQKGMCRYRPIGSGAGGSCFRLGFLSTNEVDSTVIGMENDPGHVLGGGKIPLFINQGIKHQILDQVVFRLQAQSGAILAG